MGDNDLNKAHYWMTEAANKFNSFGWFSNSKYEEAAEMYKKAANLFKKGKHWEEAAHAFVKGADCYLQVQSKHDVASNYIEAASCYKKTDKFNDAVKCLKIGTEYYTDEGRFSTAAKYQKEIAEIYENAADLEAAIENFQIAADYYEGDGSSTTHANNCLLKVAQLSAQISNYDKAIEIYEKLAMNCIEHPMLKWNVRDYLFRGGLCQLCKADDVAMTKALEKYQQIDPSFEQQREFKLLEKLHESYQDMNHEKFTEAILDFESISKLESWKVTLLNRIKDSMKTKEETDILC